MEISREFIAFALDSLIDRCQQFRLVVVVVVVLRRWWWFAIDVKVLIIVREISMMRAWTARFLPRRSQVVVGQFCGGKRTSSFGRRTNKENPTRRMSNALIRRRSEMYLFIFCSLDFGVVVGRFDLISGVSILFAFFAGGELCRCCSSSENDCSYLIVVDCCCLRMSCSCCLARCRSNCSLTRAVLRSERLRRNSCRRWSTRSLSKRVKMICRCSYFGTVVLCFSRRVLIDSWFCSRSIRPIRERRIVSQIFILQKENSEFQEEPFSSSLVIPNALLGINFRR